MSSFILVASYRRESSHDSRIASSSTGTQTTTTPFSFHCPEKSLLLPIAKLEDLFQSIASTLPSGNDIGKQPCFETGYICEKAITLIMAFLSAVCHSFVILLSRKPVVDQCDMVQIGRACYAGGYIYIHIGNVPIPVPSK